MSPREKLVQAGFRKRHFQGDDAALFYAFALAFAEKCNDLEPLRIMREISFEVGLASTGKAAYGYTVGFNGWPTLEEFMTFERGVNGEPGYLAQHRDALAAGLAAVRQAAQGAE